MNPFEALGDPNRRAIVELLRDGDRSVQALADELPISRPAVSQHLKVLLDAGLVDVRQEGRQRLYSVRVDGLEPVRRELEAFWGGALANLKRIAEQTYDPPEHP